MKIEVSRPDLASSPSLVTRWQLAISMFVKINGYADKMKSIFINQTGVVVAEVIPDLDATQTASFKQFIQTVKSVSMSRQPGQPIQYNFTYI